MKAEREIQVNRKESREYEIIKKKKYKKWEEKHRRQESRNKEQQQKQEIVRSMVNFNPTISRITMNINLKETLRMDHK